ncbi:hypothetical protein [Streptomyces sp. NPDC056987]|uniref:hypothetical protein n=1 Tax=Streptomyces sp. NPDC056987 TaxID=3345988 RepID=UPI0036425055
MQRLGGGSAALAHVRGRTVEAASPAGSVSPRGDLRLPLDDPRELAAVNSLLAQGVRVRRTADGGRRGDRAVVGPAAGGRSRGPSRGGLHGDEGEGHGGAAPDAGRGGGEDGMGAPRDAAGRASVVSGTSAAGARVTLFGTEPLFRDHPKGLFSQVGRALLAAAG